MPLSIFTPEEVNPGPPRFSRPVPAGSVNPGLERIVCAYTSLIHAQLIWSQTWQPFSEIYSGALVRIIDAHHDLPITRNCGEAERTSSDLQFFTAYRSGGTINAGHGTDPGLKIHSFLPGQHGSFHSSVIGATAGEAPFVPEGVAGNPTTFNLLIHHADTDGVSDHDFARLQLRRLKFALRHRGFANSRSAVRGASAHQAMAEAGTEDGKANGRGSHPTTPG